MGVNKQQSEVITYEEEEKLWHKGLLGEDSPDVLRDTMHTHTHMHTHTGLNCTHVRKGFYMHTCIHTVIHVPQQGCHNIVTWL